MDEINFDKESILFLEMELKENESFQVGWAYALHTLVTEMERLDGVGIEINGEVFKDLIDKMMIKVGV